MAENSKIEWCDHTFNPWTGCMAVSPACDNCYAEAIDKRFGHADRWGPRGQPQCTSHAYWQQPLRWNRQAEAAGVRRRVFCASMADVFDNRVPTLWRAVLWALIASTPHLDWLLLTKRPQNILGMLPSPELDVPEWGGGWRNVWLGTTAENQREADRRIPHLLGAPAHIWFLSCEPLLGPVELDLCGKHSRIGWIIAGGESGRHARPTHIEWLSGLHHQCVAAGVPFFFKQWGEWAPAYGKSDVLRKAVRMHGGASFDVAANEQPRMFDMLDISMMWRPGKAAAGAALYGHHYREWPRGL